jgi:hypothetical protein
MHTLLQEVLGRTNRVLFFDTTRTAMKTEIFGGDIQTHRQQEYLISLLYFSAL